MDVARAVTLLGALVFCWGAEFLARRAHVAAGEDPPERSFWRRKGSVTRESPTLVRVLWVCGVCLLVTSAVLLLVDFTT